MAGPPGRVAVAVQATADAPVEHVFASIVPIDLASVFAGYGPLPAVTGVSEQTGAWDHPGATRKVHLADGSVLREELRTYDAPRRFSYRVGPFTRPPVSLLVVDAEGDWTFTEPAPGRTHISWTYAFAPRTGRAALVRAIVAPLWRRYAARALAACVAAAETGSGGLAP